MELQNVSLHLELDAELPKMLGDPSQIQQCIVNLFFNSMEAMPEGGDLTVRTRWEKPDTSRGGGHRNRHSGGDAFTSFRAVFLHQKPG